MPTSPPRYDTMTDDDLVKRALHGSASAADVLWRRHQSFVWAVISGILPMHDDADVAMADLRLRLHQRLDQYRLGSSYRKWLGRVAANIAHTMARSVARSRVLAVAHVDETSTDGTVGPETLAVESADEAQRIAAIVGVLRGLSPVLSATAWLYWCGLDCRSISRALRAPYGTTLWRMQRVRSQLRRAGGTSGSAIEALER